MRIKFFGEGTSDVSDPETGYIPQLLEIYTTKILENSLNKNIRFTSETELIPRLTRGGFKRKVALAMKMASNGNCDASVFVVDCSGHGSDKRLRKMKEGRELGKQELTYMPIALGLAVQEIEAWVMADRHECGEQLENEFTSLVPNDLEGLDKPKNKFKEIYGAYKAEKRESAANFNDIRISIAENSDMEKLKKLRHFSLFYEEVKSEISHLFR